MISLYQKLFRYVPEKKPLALWSVLVSACSTVSGVLSYYFFYLFLRQLFAKEGELSLRFAWIFAGLLALSVLLYFASGMLSHLLGFRLETNLRKRGIRGLAAADFRFYDTHASGKVRKLIDDNASQTHQIVAHLIPDQSEALLAPLLIVPLGFFIHPYLGAFLLVLCLLSVLSVRMMTGEMEFMKSYTRMMEEMSAEMVEYVRGIPVVKIFKSSLSSFGRLHASIRGYSEAVFAYSLSCRRPYVFLQLLFMAIAAFAIPITLPLAGGVLPGSDLAALLIMLLFLSGALFSSLMKIMYVEMYAAQGAMAVDKLEELFSEADKMLVRFGRETHFESFDIAFEDVSFSYGETPVLEHVSFALPEGRTYALVGPSGGGKSTIAKLLSGFYRVDEGAIKIGGRALSDYSEQALLSAVSFVFQDVRLFKRSLFENVALAKPGASREEVLKAMEHAGCQDILDKFPAREDTVIGSKGVYLSGGETQRIAIARALLKDAPIVVFDESSASLDADNEYLLQQAFARLMKGKTVIMIAHRLSSIRSADEILVIDRGRVAERGSDAQLTAKPSLYGRLQAEYQQTNSWEVCDA